MSPQQKKKQKQKRGVILLIVVSLLTLLVLIGVTFVLFANRSNDAAKVNLRGIEYREPPEKMFELVVGQLLWDTAARSALRGHSLLADLYGTDYVTGLVVNPPDPLTDPPVGNPPLQPNGPQWGGQV